MASSYCTLLFLSLPVNTFVGLDLLSFQSSPNFHGITNVPPGYHFIYTSPNASLAIRHGRWLRIPKLKRVGQTPLVYVFKWSGTEECLVLLPGDSPEATAAKNAIPTLQDRPAGSAALVQYQDLEDAKQKQEQQQQRQEQRQSQEEQEQEQEQHEDDNEDYDNYRPSSSDWRHLISHIDVDNVLTRILGTDWTLTSVSSAPQDADADADHIPGLSRLEASSVLSGETKLSFAPINLKQTWPAEAIGRDRTDRARDRSWYLSHLIDSLAPDMDLNRQRQAGARALLGELQFCFAMVLVLANYSCLEQWKRILSVILTCQTALTEVEPFFVEVLKLLTLQMAHVDDVDGGLFDLHDDTTTSGSSSWLRLLIRKFRGHLEEADIQTGTSTGTSTGTGTDTHSSLLKQLDSFEAFMKNRYNWDSGRDWLKRGYVELEDGDKVEVTVDGADEDDETGEYAPVIVET